MTTGGFRHRLEEKTMTRLDEFKMMINAIETADTWDAYPEYFERLCDWYDIDLRDIDAYGGPEGVFETIKKEFSGDAGENNMDRKALVFEVKREGYDIDQVEGAITVGQLKEMLESLDEDMLVICSHDNGYTYGTLPRVAMIMEERPGDEGWNNPEWEETDMVEAWR